MPQIGVVATFHAKKGQGARLREILDEVVDSAAQEPGTILYAVHSPLDQEDVLWVYELYASSEAQIEHSKSAAVEQFRGKLRDVVAEPPKVEKAPLYRMVGRLSPTPPQG